jgi:hypothetical protein
MRSECMRSECMRSECMRSECMRSNIYIFQCKIYMKGGVVLLKRKAIERKAIEHNSNKKFDIYKASIILSFNAIADINNWPREEAAIAVSEYFALILKHKTNKTKKVGGAAGETFYKFANWISSGTKSLLKPNFDNPVIKLLVGSIDTPCSTLLTIISVGVWSVFIYNIVNKVSPEEAQRSLAQPVQYVIYNVSPALYELENTIHSTILNYISAISIPPTIVSLTQIVSTLRTIFYEATLYKTAFEQPIVCALKHLIESCEVECNQRQLNIIKNILNKPNKSKKSITRSKTRSKSRTRSKSKTRSKSRARSKSKKSQKSIYYTPNEK